MPRKPTASQLADQVDDLVKALKTAKSVFPVLAEQARLELAELRGNLPTCERGVDYSNDPAPHYSDPTGEHVVNFRPHRDGNCDPTEDLERIAHWVSDVGQLVRTTRRMLNNAPAVTLAVVDGRKPTDGRSAAEHAQRKFVRVLTDSHCLIAQDHEDEDLFGPGQLRRGMCDRHRKAFARWLERYGEQWADETSMLIRWQHETFGSVAGANNSPSTEDAGAYKKLREVA